MVFNQGMLFSCRLMQFFNSVFPSNFKSIFFLNFLSRRRHVLKKSLLEIFGKLSKISKKSILQNICKKIFLIKVHEIIKLYEATRLRYYQYQKIVNYFYKHRLKNDHFYVKLVFPFMLQFIDQNKRTSTYCAFKKEFSLKKKK